MYPIVSLVNRRALHSKGLIRRFCSRPTISVPVSPKLELPDMDTGYHGLHQGRKDWENLDAAISKEEVVIDGHPVMESWEQPYMNKLASIAAGNGGIVLEGGFGLGLSGRSIQNWNIKEHIIIEANKDVYKSLLQFAAKEAQRGRPRVTPLFGLWEDVVATMPDNLVDGILYDTYPQSRDEQHIHQFDFIRQAHRILKPSGIL